MTRSSAASAPKDIAAVFERLTGRPPEGLWRSPGRVNLIGEHTDYNDGLVLPAAIDRAATVAAGPRADGVMRVASLQLPGLVTVRLCDVRPGIDWGWPAPLLGMVWALRLAGVQVRGLDVVVDSAIPIGGGLASSAAVAVALALAVTELAGHPLPMLDIARAGRTGEESIAGAPTGIMDQVAVLAGARDSAVLLDCRSLEHCLVPFAPEPSGAVLVVIDTGVAHDNSARGYRERRRECEQAAAALGVGSLRDAALDDVGSGLRGTLRRRGRHVVTENTRVLRVVELLRAGSVAEIGPLLNESHASLRDDFDVSCPELDCAVAAAQSAGAWGARMTGAGFGGSAIALVPADKRDELERAVRSAFADRGYASPATFDVTTAAGARRVD